MGADLILCVVPMVPGDRGWPVQDSTWDTWRSDYKARIAKLDAKQLLGIYEDAYGDAPYVNEDTDLPERAWQQVLGGEAKQHFEELVDRFINKDYLTRDCDMFYINGGWVMIAGGTSWGDSPCEDWDELYCLSSIYSWTSDS